MNKIVVLIIITLLFAGCSKATSAKVPDGVRQKFYDQSVEVVKVIDAHMKNVEEFNTKDKQQIDLYFAQKPKTKQEADIQNQVNLLYVSYTTNLTSNQMSDTKGKNKSLSTYTEDRDKLNKLLNLDL